MGTSNARCYFVSYIYTIIKTNLQIILDFSTWNVRNCNPLIDVLEEWMPVLPPWIMDNVIDQLVLPRLTAEVTIWNPLTDTTPIHVWIHPWIPLLGIIFAINSDYYH